jgi:UDP-N-acetylglucosamine 1-carboxyvinyltransferase
VGRFVVEGGRRLTGRFVVSGAKNAALPILAATTLVAAPVTLRRVPIDILDVQHMLAMLRQLGASVTVAGPDELVIDASGPLSSEIPEEFTRTMRASIFLMGPLLARLGAITVARPGGCNIGIRPIDLHLSGLAALGARFTDLSGGRIHAEAGRLAGGVIYLDFPSVGATENVLMAAALASGDTVIENAAREPEVVDLAQFLTSVGIVVRGAGTDRIVVRGHSGPLSGSSYELIPDRIEAGTMAIATALTDGEVTLVGVIPEHLVPLWRKLRQMGVEVRMGDDRVTVRGTGKLYGTALRTGPHPGFPTDLQPPMLTLMTQARGPSTLVETVFENRLGHAGELQRMGANVLADGRMAVVYGPTALSGTVVEAGDLRAGAALVLAGLVARGTTTVMGAEMVARGYQHWAGRLTDLGAQVRLVTD